MSNETSGGGDGPNGPTTTIHWKKWETILKVLFYAIMLIVIFYLWATNGQPPVP